MLPDFTMISSHWFTQWSGTSRQQAITWANVCPDLFRHMVSPGHNKLRYCRMSWVKNFIEIINLDVSFGLGIFFNENDNTHQFG